MSYLRLMANLVVLRVRWQPVRTLSAEWLPGPWQCSCAIPFLMILAMSVLLPMLMMWVQVLKLVMVCVARLEFGHGSSRGRLRVAIGSAAYVSVMSSRSWATG